jgi:signal transduction histidine kinase
MFKTIFSKLIIIFISILILGFLITGILLNYFLDSFATADKYKYLNQHGGDVSSAISENISEFSNPLFRRTLQKFFNQTGALIWVVSNDGTIVLTNNDPITDSIDERILKHLIVEANGNIRLPDPKQYKKVMEGESDVIKETGDFYGLFSDTDYSWLTIEKPIRVKKDGKIEVIGAVYLHTTILEVQKIKKSILYYFLISVAVSIFISIVLIYIFSLKISRPLKQIKNAAKEIAGGEFQKRLNIKAKDEIGELAITFNNMAIALQNLEEMRRGFIANVSHELRTPMTSIRGFIEGILDGTIPPERQNNYLTIVREETIRLSRLVTDLLDLARMESGEISLSYRNFNITELIRRSIIKLESLIISKNIQIEANFEEENIQAFADVDAIERVIINLMHNAVKFSNEKGKIKISVEYFKDKILVTIEDNGIGIERDEIDLIWDRFYKSDKSRGKDKTGTGLGLAIIKSIINEHNQEIWVESELEVGTKFKFTLSKAEKSI